MRGNSSLHLFVVMALAVLPGACGSAPSHSSGHSVPAVTATKAVTSIALKQLGSPYRYGGATPYGFDCSGLVYYAYTQAGYKVPRTTGSQYQQAFLVSDDKLQEGDILFFNVEGKVSHVGLYLGKGTFIHAPSSGKVVSYASLQDPYWKKRLVKAGRFF